MSVTLVTGGTGIVGNSVIQELLRRGRAVRALVRSVERARPVVPAGCELVAGDVTDPASLRAAIAGCDVVYHSAGLPEQWLRDAGVFDRVNVGGTENMITAALAAGVRRFVYTSTIDVFAAGTGEDFDESVVDPYPKGTVYERSKQRADRAVVAALDRGLPAVFLHPSAVYGPVLAGSPGVNDLLKRLTEGRAPALLPGGMPYVYCHDVAAGHVAAEAAAVGERFILSERYATLVELATLVVELGYARRVPRVLPLRVAGLVSTVTEALAGATGLPPLVPRGQLHFLQWQARPSSRKAREQLGWSPVPWRDGVARTLASLRR
jgi:dihydroflavonol-4-reductase